MQKLSWSLLILFFFLGRTTLFSQSNFQLQWEYDYTGFTSPRTVNADILNRPFLYAASGESGLHILNIDGTPLTVVDTFALEMSAQSFTQYGNLLYVAIGRPDTDDPSGLAIVDVTSPAFPVVLDTWVHPPSSLNSGSGIVKVEGNYAYLGAMQQGLVILDVSVLSNITFVSELVLNINYPVMSPPTPSFYNLRGLEVRNDIVYGTMDAGGLRIINCVNKLAPVQTGQYANPITYVPFNRPRAYNNIVLNDTVAYVAVDYCGVEVIRISDTANLVLLDNFNPHNCPTGSWYGAPIHANELVYNNDCQELFVATGQSEMISFDVSDPMNIDSTGMYGSLGDTTATWGVGMRNDSLFLSYVLIPVYISWLHPFDAKWNGIKCVKWMNPCVPLGTEERTEELSLSVSPNPATGSMTFRFELDDPVSLEIRDLMGRCVRRFDSGSMVTGINELNWNGKDGTGNELPAGIYFARLSGERTSATVKLVRSR